MPKTAQKRDVGKSAMNEVPVSLFELDAKTKDSDGKETKFTYRFPQFPDSTTLEDVVKALTYQNSKKETISGKDVLLGYANTALKNEHRSAELARTTGVLKMREDPEAAIKGMVDQMVLAFGVQREVAEANVRALIASGAVKVAENSTPATT